MKTFLFRAFIICVLIGQASPANIWNDHFKPSITDGFDWTGVAIIGIGVLGVAVSQPQDKNTRSNYRNYQRMNSQWSKFGDILGTGVPGALIGGLQLIWDSENGWAHVEALFNTFITTSALKGINNRKRPSSNNRHSMPSGHTSTVFASATSLTYAYGWKAAIPAYSLAVLTAVSRLSDDAHWLSDTIAGAAVGTFWGRATSFHHGNGKVSVFWNHGPEVFLSYQY